MAKTGNTATASILHRDRFFGPDATQIKFARQLYESIAGLPLLCPHGHVDPQIFVDPNYSFGNPAELFIIPDHYVFRMLFSQGIALEKPGIAGQSSQGVEKDPRKIWQLFAANFQLFSATPSGIWLTHELQEVFGVEERLNAQNGSAIYDHLAAQLVQPEFKPRQLFERFKIEVLCTTDAATDALLAHQALKSSAWSGRVLPSFRPDGVIQVDHPQWLKNLKLLEECCRREITSYTALIRALEERRTFFKKLGAKAIDVGVTSPYSGELGPLAADAIFQRARHGHASAQDSLLFSGQMLLELARMCTEDGLVMQLHAGVYRNHHQALFENFGADKGADIPLATEFTKNLSPLLNKFGADARFRLILFTLDESTYSRELAPLAGHYPALRLGPPWWFMDSLNGMARYFDQVIETAGVYNTAGFNDDTRAFCSIPARHDLWRRASANWLAGLVQRHIIGWDTAFDLARALAYDLAKVAYNL